MTFFSWAAAGPASANAPTTPSASAQPRKITCLIVSSLIASCSADILQIAGLLSAIFRPVEAQRNEIRLVAAVLAASGQGTLEPTDDSKGCRSDFEWRASGKAANCIPLILIQCGQLGRARGGGSGE